MKPSMIFHQYVWIINTLRRKGRLTFEQLNRRWMAEGVADGNPLPRSTFNRHRDAILDMFGVVIDCEKTTGYQYYIANPSVLDNDTIHSWMLSTLTVGSVLSDSLSIQERIILENVPAGEEYLQTIIRAIKSNRKLKMGYKRFDDEGYEITVEPYALKLFHQRWYMLTFTGHHIATYSLDRITSLKITDISFKMPSDFQPEDYFKEYFGVLTDESVPMQHVVVRVYGHTPNYLRTLPLHYSQKEIYTSDEYTEFTYDIRPTFDFCDHLLTHGPRIEVIKPESLREQIANTIKEMQEKYK